MKKYKVSNLLCTVLAAIGLQACIGSGDNADVKFQGNNQFPVMTGIDLQGDERQIPNDFEGQFNLVTVAFKREQQEQVDSWISYADQLTADNDQIRYYELPIIYEMTAAGRFWVNNGMRAGVKAETARNRTITVYTDRDPLMENMNWDMDTITTYLLDQNGNILWRKDGVYNDNYATEIENAVK